MDPKAKQVGPWKVNLLITRPILLLRWDVALERSPRAVYMGGWVRQLRLWGVTEAVIVGVYFTLSNTLTDNPNPCALSIWLLVKWEREKKSAQEKKTALHLFCIFFSCLWHILQIQTLALIYQMNVETSTDPSTEIILWQGSRVIHETFVSHRSQLTNDRVLINVVAENNRHLNITPLNILSLKASPLEFTTWRCVICPRRGTSLTLKLSP